MFLSTLCSCRFFICYHTKHHVAEFCIFNDLIISCVFVLFKYCNTVFCSNLYWEFENLGDIKFFTIRWNQNGLVNKQLTVSKKKKLFFVQFVINQQRLISYVTETTYIYFYILFLKHMLEYVHVYACEWKMQITSSMYRSEPVTDYHSKFNRAPTFKNSNKKPTK